MSGGKMNCPINICQKSIEIQVVENVVIGSRT